MVNSLFWFPRPWSDCRLTKQLPVVQVGANVYQVPFALPASRKPASEATSGVCFYQCSRTALIVGAGYLAVEFDEASSVETAFLCIALDPVLESTL